MTEPSPDPSPPLVVSRRTPWSIRIAIGLSMILGVFGFPALLVLSLEVYVRSAIPGLRGGTPHWTERLAEALPFGTAATIGTLIGLLLTPLAAFFMLTIFARRRYGRVEVHPDHLVFRFAITPPWVKQTVLAEEITTREPSRGGLLLEVSDRWRATRMLFPLLVPTHDEAVQRQILADLDEVAPNPEQEGAVFGRKPPPVLVALLVAFVFVLATPPLAVVGLRFGSEPLILSLVVVSVALIPLMGLGDAWFIQPRYRRVHLGSQAVLLAGRRIPYDDLTRAATQGPYLALEVGRRRLLARLGDELPAAVELLRQRLGARATPLSVSEVAPAWAQPAARRRRLALLIGAIAATVGAFTAAAFSNPELYDDAYVTDDEGQYLRVIYRISDRKPRLVSLLVDDPDESWTYFLDDKLVVPGLYVHEWDSNSTHFLLDLKKRRAVHHKGGAVTVDAATTWFQVDISGSMRGSTVELPAALTDAVLAAYEDDLQQPSIPALLASVLGDVDDPVIQSYLSGESSRRSYDLRGSDGWRLLWGLDQGEVVFATIAPSELPLNLLVGTFRHEDEAQTVPADVRAAFAYFQPGSSQAIDLGSQPALEALREATAAIEGGVGVRAACASLLEGPLDRWREDSADRR